MAVTAEPTTKRVTRSSGLVTGLAGLALGALLALILAVPAAAQGLPAARQAQTVKINKYLQIRTDTTAAVVVGDTAWVAVSIRAKEPLEDVRFTASLADGSVAYPANTVDHSGPYNGYQLDQRETDYVAFRVTIPDGVGGGRTELVLDASWTNGGEAMRATDVVTIPLVEHQGAPYSLVSSSVTLTDLSNGWVEVSFAGLAPRLESFEVTVVDPPGLDVYYPHSTYTSLARDDLLEDGETDVVRFRLVEAHWGQRLDLQLEVRYRHQGAPQQATHALTVLPG